MYLICFGTSMILVKTQNMEAYKWHDEKKTQPELVMAYGNSFPSVQIERYTSKLCRTFCKYDFDNNNNKKIIFYCILYA